MQDYDPFSSYAGQYTPQEYAQTAQNRGLATASLVIGIISCLALGLGGLGTIAGIVLGIVALRRARRDPEHYGGSGMAVAGIITSIASIFIAVTIIFAATRTVPQMIANVRISQHENIALVRMRGIARAEKIYREYGMPGTYGTLEELRARRLIDHGAVMDGYRYSVRVSGNSYEATATPEEYGISGRISFYVSTDGAIHLADRKGEEASASDPTGRGVSDR